MKTLLKLPALLILSTAMAAGAAQAGVVDINIGGANLYSLGSFNPTGAQVEGSLLVGKDMNAANYTVNTSNKDAFGSSAYALVVGGNLNYNSGSIQNGSYYVGGTTAISSNTGLNTATRSTTSPVFFADLSTTMKSTSTALAAVAKTGTTTVQYGGMTLTGGSGNVQVFDIKSSDLGAVNYFNFANLSAKETLILNVSGTDVNMSGGGNFGAYNVLFNFYEATRLDFSNVALYGTVLAPLATVVSNGGDIYGSAVVGNWASSTTLHAGSGTAFQATDVAGFAAAVSPVPEPGTWAMLLAGLGLVGFVARRRKNQAVA